MGERRANKGHKRNNALRLNNEVKAMRFSIRKDPITWEWVGYERGVEIARRVYRWDVQIALRVHSGCQGI